MFIGHYAIGFLARRWEGRLPLWILLLAVQFVDVLWAVFVLLGIEHLRIVPGATGPQRMDLYYMPYTHSLLSTLVWFGVAFVGYRFAVRAADNRSAVVVAVAVASHWFLDLIVHLGDLPLYDDAHKQGLALWSFPIPAFVLEVSLLGLGLVFYLRRKDAAPRLAWTVVFCLVMVLAHTALTFGPAITSPNVAAGGLLGVFVTFTACAYGLERNRD